MHARKPKKSMNSIVGKAMTGLKKEGVDPDVGQFTVSFFMEITGYTSLLPHVIFVQLTLFF